MLFQLRQGREKGMNEDVTRLMNAAEDGDPQAADELLPLVYSELRRMAAQKMANERSGHTLQPTALVHEAYLRLVRPSGDAPSWKGRGHFFGAAAEAMRRILIDSARRKAAQKHGGQFKRVTLDTMSDLAADEPETLLAVDEALEELAKVDERKAQLVKLKVFGGLTYEEIASAMGISLSTVRRDWAYAIAWLGAELGKER